MLKRYASKRHGFTLIELLVVVAIIALLISILLPSLRDAREQGKIGKCLGNCRNMQVGVAQYLIDHNDYFAIGVTTAPGWLGMCPWVFAGKTNSDFWRTIYNGVFFVEGYRRPVNKYIVGTNVEPDIMNGNIIEKRTEVPSMQCPSDRISHKRWQTGAATDILDIGAYNDVGQSYQYNLFALHDVNVNLWGNMGQGWADAGRELVRTTLARHASTFMMFITDPIAWGLSDTGKAKTVELGFHGKFGRHEISFFDGHAEYRYVDTRGWCGPGWAAINPDWICHYGQPLPRIHYTSGGSGPGRPPDYTKNCHPPLQ